MRNKLKALAYEIRELAFFYIFKVFENTLWDVSLAGADIYLIFLFLLLIFAFRLIPKSGYHRAFDSQLKQITAIKTALLSQTLVFKLSLSNRKIIHRVS